MRRAWFPASLLSVVVLFLSCGGGSSSTPFTPTPAGSTSLNLTIRDTPPAGVSILSFEITVTGAVLHQGTTDVSILNSPVKVEITQLETESAFLSTQGVPAGTYDGITVTFASPEMTIQNNSGAAVAGCAAGAVCDDITPPLSPASVDFSGNPPFPLSLTADTATGLLLDFNLDASVQNDLSIQPSIGFTQMPVMQETEELDELEDMSGQVASVDTANNQFALQSNSSGQTFTIKVDDSTQFENFGEAGLQNTFASLAAGQIVEVDVKLNGDGSMLATKIQLKEPEQGEELEGTIVSVDPGLTKFDMVVLDEIPDIAGVQVGNVVTVTLATGVTFGLDTEDLSIPSDVSFASAADLVTGQQVEVRPGTGSSGTSITAERVRLHTSQLTAQVAATSGSNFTVNNLPDLFTNAGITEIQVRTTSQTEFEGISDASALSTGDNLALRGLLFKTTGTPVLLAKKVRKL